MNRQLQSRCSSARRWPAPKPPERRPKRPFGEPTTCPRQAALSRSLHIDATAHALFQIALPSLADMAAVALLDGHGELVAATCWAFRKTRCRSQRRCQRGGASSIRRSPQAIHPTMSLRRGGAAGTDALWEDRRTGAADRDGSVLPEAIEQLRSALSSPATGLWASCCFSASPALRGPATFADQRGRRPGVDCDGKRPALYAWCRRPTSGKQISGHARPRIAQSAGADTQRRPHHARRELEIPPWRRLVPVTSSDDR